MGEGESDGERQRGKSSDFSIPKNGESVSKKNDTVVTGILDERIANLREAIHEIDAALVGRKHLNVKFIEQIDREAEEAKNHLNTLQPPWKMGFYPEMEFLRLSLHKSLTSRAKERRGEQLKYWENGVNLAKERRKFLDEYKELLATKRRLRGHEH